MTTPLLLLRLRILRRIAAELPRTGPFPALVIVAMLGAAQWRLFAWAGDATGRWVVAASNVAVLLAVHAARRDERLLRVAGVAHRRLFAAEYLLLCVPFAVPQLLTGSAQLAAVGPAAALLVPLSPAGLVPAILAQRAQRRTPMPLPLPATAFEWHAGVRRSAPWLATLYLAAALLSHQSAVLLAIHVLVALTPAAFYQDGEGSTMVEVFALPPGAFLRHKIGEAIVLSGGLAAPVAVLYALRHPAQWYVPLAVLVLGAYVVAGAVLVKYALYVEGERRAVASPLAIAAVTASLALPPVAALLLHRLWKQSVRTLEPYLYAFDR